MNKPQTANLVPYQVPYIVNCPETITTLGDAYQLMHYLYDIGISFHPDDSLVDIVTANGKPVFTKKEGKRLDRLMTAACKLCAARNQSVYGLAMIELQKRFMLDDGKTVAA